MSFEQRRDRGTRADAPGHLSYELREADDGRWQVSLRGPASSEVAARLADVAPLFDLSTSHDEVTVLVEAGRHPTSTASSASRPRRTPCPPRWASSGRSIPTHPR